MLDKLVITWILSAGVLGARPFLVGWDESFALASHSSGQEFDRTPGDLEVSDYWLRVLAPEPASAGVCLCIQPALDYRATVFRFNDVPTELPVDRSNLESFNVYPSVLELSALAWLDGQDSPWMFGAWASAGLATDFRNVDREDLTFGIAAGAGYRFSDSFSAGLGAAITDLSDESRFMPGIGLDWRINDRIRIAICGPVGEASYNTGKEWRFSLRGDSTSQIWNISDDEGKPRDLDFTSYRLGLFASRSLGGNIRATAGAGVTFGTEMRLLRTNGDVILEQRLDSGFFCQIGLVIMAW